MICVRCLCSEILRPRDSSGEHVASVFDERNSLTFGVPRELQIRIKVRLTIIYSSNKKLLVGFIFGSNVSVR